MGMQLASMRRRNLPGIFTLHDSLVMLTSPSRTKEYSQGKWG
jgi:hypothetical protein